MACELTLNPGTCLNPGTGVNGFLCTDINRCSSGNVQRDFWMNSQGDKVNIHDVYNWLVNNNKTRTSVNITNAIFDDAYNNPNGANAQSLLNRFDWTIGSLYDSGLAFGLNGNSTTTVTLLINIRNNGVTRLIVMYTLPIEVGVGSGSNDDYYWYMFDRLYFNGVLSTYQPVVNSRAYSIEYVQFPVLQPVYNVVAENTMDNVLSYDGGELNIIGEGNIGYRRHPGLTSGIDRRSHSDFMDDLINATAYTPDPNEGGGSGATGGGGGTPRDSIRIPDFELPPNILLQSGIIKMFSPSIAQMNSFVNWIYSSADSVITNFKKLWVEPMNSIVSLSMIPCYAPSITNETMKFCGVDSEIEAPLISEQFITIDCGYKDVNEEYNTFLDYSSFTGVKLYLPFVGIVDLNTDDVMGARLYLKYNIDLFTGESIAYLRCVKNNTDYKNIYDAPLYAWDANVVYSVPITGNNWQQLYNGIAKLVTSGISGAVVGGGAGAVVGALSDIGNFATTSKVSYSRGGSLKANGGFLGGYTPYLIFNAPISSVPKLGGNSGVYRGFPSDIEDKLSNFHGYTEIERDTLHLTDFSNYATDEEIEMIHEMLINGVVLP